jgi:glycosyltransferase involved in cell wall biosynthesis
LKVLHVIDKSFLGGGQTTVRNLIQGFRGSSVKTLLACREGGPLADDARRLGSVVHPVPFDKRFRPGPARAIASIVQGSSVDVLHAHGLVAATYCTLARSLFGVRSPLLYHQHGFHHHNYGRLTVRARKAAERWVCRRADRIVPVTEEDARTLEGGRYAPRDRIETVHYGIPEPSANPAEMEEARRLAGVEPGRPVVGLVGRLHPQKGIDVFLRATARVQRERPDSVALVVGTGPEEAPLRDLARTLGVSEGIRWMGGRSATPFLPLLRAAALSSRWEGLPLVLLEYMAMGLPIVTTSLPGCLEAVGTEEAEVVPPEDPDAMAGAILRLLQSPESASRLAAAARSRFLDRFTLASMTRRFEAIYCELLA